MGIIFFEDFSQDTTSTIATRFAVDGSTRYVLGTDLGGWPLSKATTTAFWKKLPINTSNRTELYLEMEDNGYGTRTNNVSCFYGIIVYAPNATSLNIYGGNTTGSTPSAFVVPGFSTPRSITRLYLDLNYNTRKITVIINGLVYANKRAMPSDWYTWYQPAADSAFYQYNTNGCPYLANTVKKIVIATDNPDDKRLDLDTLQFTRRSLVYDSSSVLTYTDAGYVEDVNKTDPSLTSPGLETETIGMVQYTTTEPLNHLASKVYTGGWSENPDKYVSVGEEPALIPRMPNAVQEVPVEGTVLKAVISDVQPFTAEVVVNNTAVALSPRFTNPSAIAVDWGDGEVTSVGTLGRIDHNYLTTGTYQVKIYGRCTRLVLASEHLTKVLEWGSLGLEGLQFYKATATGDPELTSPNLVEVPTYLPRQFIDLSNMFWGASSFNQSILNGEWDLRNVRLMPSFLRLSGYNQEINLVTGASSMLALLYQSTSFNKPIRVELLSGPRNVTLESMASGLTSWNSAFTLTGRTDRVTSALAMFSGDSLFNQPLQLSLPYVTSANMASMMLNCAAFNQDCSTWCVSSATTLPSNFATGATSWILPKPVWGTCPLGA